MGEKSSKLVTLSKYTPLITVLLGFLGIVIPIMGFALEQGYLSAFGISREYLPREFTELWSQSFYVVLYALSLYVPNYWIPFVIVFIFFLVVFFLVSLIVGFRSYFEKQNYHFKLPFKNKYLQYSVEVLCQASKETFKYFPMLYSLTLVILLSGLLIIWPFEVGQGLARNDIEKYHYEKCGEEGWSKCVQIQDLETNIILYKEYMVTATSKHIVLYDGQQTTVISRLPTYAIIRNKSPKN